MKKKARKFDQGGGVGDDVRARAMRFIQGETELSGKYHGDSDPLAGVIKAAEARDVARTSKKTAEPVSSAPVTTVKRIKPRLSSDTYENARRAMAQRGFGYDTTPTLADLHEMAVKEDIRKGRRHKSGGVVKTASKRADGIAQRGKTRGKVC